MTIESIFGDHFGYQVFCRMLCHYGGSGHKKAPKLICLEAFVTFSIKIRDPAGTRTQDPYIKSVLLYQLSYGIIPFLGVQK